MISLLIQKSLYQLKHLERYYVDNIGELGQCKLKL